MGLTPSRLTDHHQTLVLDASVVINLLGSGQPARLLRAIARPAVVVDIAKGEIKRDPSTRKSAATVLDALESQGLLKCVSLSDAGFEAFLALVGAVPPDGLGDGEAATIAYAEEVQGAILIDERKALRIASARSTPRPVLSTLDLFSSRLSEEGIPTSELADLVFASLCNARMRVPRQFRPWVTGLIGAQRAAQCSTLGAATTTRIAEGGTLRTK